MSNSGNNKTHADLKQQVQQLGSFIGKTPLYPIKNLNNNSNVSVYAKLEWLQFGASVKARPAYRIIKDAIDRGDLSREKQLIDASSGNTGIAYAHIGAALGIPVTLFLPEDASEERKQILRALGVNLNLTPAEGGTDQSREMARETYQKEPNKYFYADQYSNPSNWSAHYDSTGPEIIAQTDNQVTHFIVGLGTTGTFTGTGRYFKKNKPDTHLIALQPESGEHILEGWKHLASANVPEIYDDSIADEIRIIDTEIAYKYLKLAAREEGLLISPSAAANLAGALKLANELQEGTIVTVFADDANKYGKVNRKLFSKKE